MSADVFLDTNILLYACSAAPADIGKRKIAAELITQSHFALSAQVLQEFIANALRKPQLGLTESNIDATLRMAALVPVVPITHELVVAAVILRRKFSLSHWDATIIAAAQSIRCPIVYSEDMSHGQDYEGTRVINPFL